MFLSHSLIILILCCNLWLYEAETKTNIFRQKLYDADVIMSWLCDKLEIAAGHGQLFELNNVLGKDTVKINMKLTFI